jgi:hypothetical protein
MRFTYKFTNSVDYIDSERLNIKSFNLLIDDIKKINQEYGYDIYIYGSYLEYLVNRTTYSDINFIALLNEKMIDIDQLTQFMKDFHLLMKQYKVGYDLKFSLDLNSDMINTNPKNNILFNGEIGVITLYQPNNNDKIIKNIENSELFTSTWSSKNIDEKMINKQRFKSKFIIPLKIS